MKSLRTAGAAAASSQLSGWVFPLNIRAAWVNIHRTALEYECNEAFSSQFEKKRIKKKSILI